MRHITPRFWVYIGLLLLTCAALSGTYRYYFVSRPISMVSLLQEVKSIQAIAQPSSDIASSVVNVVCGETRVVGGSGLVISEDGIILTNYHNIADRENDTCIVTVPNPQTGGVSEIYTAQPTDVPELSARYDLSFLKIGGPYSDTEGVYGTPNRSFTSVFENCENDIPQIGSRLRVYGYPLVGGSAFYLMATEGIVSAIPGDGTIITSAEVGVGNSGGLAIDERACVVGMPSMIDINEHTNFGVITGIEVLKEFISQSHTVSLDE